MVYGKSTDTENHNNRSYSFCFYLRSFKIRYTFDYVCLLVWQLARSIES